MPETILSGEQRKNMTSKEAEREIMLWFKKEELAKVDPSEYKSETD